MRIDDSIRKRFYSLGVMDKVLRERIKATGKTNEVLENLLAKGGTTGSNLKKIKHLMGTDSESKEIFGDRFFGWVESQLNSDRQSAQSNKEVKSKLGLSKTHSRNKYQMSPQGTSVAVVSSDPNNQKGVEYIGESRLTIVITESQMADLINPR